MIICTPCKTSYNVLKPFALEAGQFFRGEGGPLKYGGGGLGVGGLVKKRESPDFISPEVSISVYESFLLEYTVKGESVYFLGSKLSKFIGSFTA